MSLEIVTCPPDRFREQLEVDALAFAEGIPAEQLERFEQYVDKSRFFTAIDDGKLVSSSGVFTFQMTVPGGELPVGGVTFVAVLPSHRRRGLATAMMRRMFDDCRDHGESIAILWASEGSIYQRFGYGLATLMYSLDLETKSSEFARDWPEPEGRVRLVSLDDALPLVSPVYDAACAQRPGFVARTPEWWRWLPLFDEKKGNAADGKHVAVYEGASGPEAYAIYRVKPDWNERGTQGQLTFTEVVASTPEGSRAIWRWLFDVDLVRTVRGWRLPPDHPLLFLAAEPRRLGIRVGDAIWLRVLDVRTALEGRRYEGDGSFVFELRDAFLPANAGRWAMRVADGVANVERTDAAADIELDATDLGSLYLGGFSAAALAGAGRITELRNGGVATASRIFSTAIAPWNPSEF